VLERQHNASPSRIALPTRRPITHIYHRYRGLPSDLCLVNAGTNSPQACAGSLLKNTELLVRRRPLHRKQPAAEHALQHHGLHPGGGWGLRDQINAQSTTPGFCAPVYTDRSSPGNGPARKAAEDSLTMRYRRLTACSNRPPRHASNDYFSIATQAISAAAIRRTCRAAAGAWARRFSSAHLMLLQSGPTPRIPRAHIGAKGRQSPSMNRSRAI